MSKQRTMVEQVTFNHPVFFSQIGEALPAGTYTVTIIEQELTLAGDTQWHVLGCRISLPQSLWPPGATGAEGRIDYKQLQANLLEDRNKDTPSGQ